MEVAAGQLIALGFLIAPLLINGRSVFERRMVWTAYGAMALLVMLAISIGNLISSSSLLLLPAIAAFTLILGWRFGLPATLGACGTFVFGYLNNLSSPGAVPTDPAYLVSLICGAIILFLGSTIYRSEMQRAADRIEAERQRAQKADRAKSEFLAMMSHEIRTPMNGVIGMLQLLSTSDIGRVEQDQARTALDSAQSLLLILNDILDYSKNDASSVELHETSFDLANTIGKLSDLFLPLAQAKGVSFNVHGLNDLPSLIVSDEEKLRQVATNLVNNAIKFTNAGSVDVTIGYRPTMPGSASGLLKLDGADTGIGIPLDLQEMVFDRFSQIDASNSRRFGGTGLGLAICRQLTEMMGGTINLKSAPGKGSRFRVEIPCENAAQSTGGASLPVPRPLVFKRA
ncbi:MAG: sensor histidine kinase [Candidatus Phaeomarinobacter sp.]